MRTIFWILLLVNVILFAVMQRGGLSWGEQQAYQAQPALHEENIRLLDAPQAAAPVKALPVPAPAPAPAGVPLPASAQTAASAPASAATLASPTPAAKPAAATKPVPASVPPPPANPAPAAKPASAAAKRNTQVCLEWGDFSGTDLKRATEVLSSMRLGGKLGQRQVEYNKGYWVYIPPLKNKAAANRRVAQIRKLGISEYFVVQEAGALRYAISLGVFKTREAAQNYLGQLNTKGLRSAKIGERASKLKTTMFILNSVDAAIEGKLAATAKDFPGSDLKNVPCALTR